MKKGLIAVTMASLFLAGCVSTAPKKDPVPVPKPSETAQTSLDYAGKYQARLACDDCDFTAAQLQINQYGQYKYQEWKIKNGAPIGQSVVFQGKYTWDKNVPIIRLLNARNMHFFVAENEVVLLSKPVASYSEITSEPKFKKVNRKI